MNPDDFKPEDPAHYQRGTIQVWDFIADQRLDFFAGNVAVSYTHLTLPTNREV